MDRLLGEWGIPRDSAAGRRQLEKELEARRKSEAQSDYRPIRRGWCLGDEAFHKELLEQVGAGLGANHFGAQRVESQEDQAERLVGKELRRRRWNEAELCRRSKGDAGKVEIAQRLRRETLVTIQWIARRLVMGSVGYVNHRLYLRARAK